MVNDETVKVKDAYEALERFKAEYWNNDKELSSTYQYLMNPYDESEADDEFQLKVELVELMLADLKLVRELGIK